MMKARNTARPPIGSVILAAGGSTRFGSPKQLVMRDGEPLVRRAAKAAIAAGARPVMVVLGADATLVSPELARLRHVRTVINEHWATGLASSLATGLRALMEIAGCDAVLVMLADQPMVDAAALRKLIAAFDQDHRIVASAYAGTIGVPAIFGCEHVEDLMRLTGDSGAGQWMRAHPDKVTTVSLPEAQVDIDTVTDIAPDEVHLWDSSLAVDADEVQRSDRLLSADEQRYASRFSDIRAKNQFIVSRGKLRELLASYADQPPRELRFGMTPEGKPFLASARELEFNLTHSAGLVLYGVARSRPVGVDVERVRKMPRAIELAKRFMSADEHERIASAPPETRDREFLSLWVKREGSGKAHGVGVWKVLESGKRDGGASAANPLFARIITSYACKVIDYSDDYVAAVAALGDDWRLVRRGSVRA